ncbi:unnamed protein product [Rotaria sp. Silwood1]|nr:unnamed protein product [Rotaria sp. Silwood1]CAF1428690.1 unnamed protein product [Rotaria sp. Silwood1]CAF3538109.1 unnamed protein product [Rotaria sp. Silwood1]CAF3619923.1 unnamed protein product [Rotaria sp. Silwood1]CAF4847280.1 unnamed protein product [Rotaria sp. Silwood1]
MLLSTFETLPDEILMIIIRYCGNIYRIFRTFSGLNQRINNILIDKRLHLLTDFLFMDIDDVNIDYYYQSKEFYDVSQQLLSLKITENDEQLRQCFQSLVTFHITYKYQQSIDLLESNIKYFQSVRMHLTHDAIYNLDNELQKIFLDLQTCSKPMKNFKQIEFLILIKGAKLECLDSECLKFNFVQAVNHLLLANITNVQFVSQQYMSSLVQMFKVLIISNPTLLYNQININHSDYLVYYFLFYSIYRLKYYNNHTSSSSLNIQYYRAAVDLLLFTLQCLKYVSIEKFWRNQNFLHLLQMISSIQLNIDHEIFVYTSQIEILKILLNENIFDETIYWNIEYCKTFQQPLQNLIINNRLDIILFIFNYNDKIKNFFQQSWNSEIIVDIIMENQKRKQLFHAILDNKSLGLWLATSTDLVFVLLQRKQYAFLKKLFHQSPLLIHRLDEDGNDPLLYACLKARGCRHRIVEYLIEMGCDVQRKNLQDETFSDALQLKGNRNLLEKLIEHEIIQIDHKSNKIKVYLVKQSQ